jgi:predicted methyltransferase
VIEETLRFFGWGANLSVVEVAPLHAGTTLAPAPGSSGRLLVLRLESPEEGAEIPPGQADLVISRVDLAAWERTFGALAHFRVLHRALRKGGTLGIVANRAEDGVSFRRMMEKGALTEAHVIALAEVAGFRWVARAGEAADDSRMVLKLVKP